MRAGPVAVFASAAVLSVSVSQAQAQQPPPQPPPAALSVPNPFAGFHPEPRDLYRSPDGSDRFQHLSQYPAPPPVVAPGIYFPGPFYYPSLYDHYMATETAYIPRRHAVAARGGLVLQTVPDLAQVFVDGYYVGLAEEFGLHGRPMDITAGTHSIELRAPGYETLTFSVMIAPNDILRYRGDMQPLATKPAAPAVVQSSVAAKRFYVIPNCYAGDKPPSGTLPKGCDLKKLQTRK
jgi:hypothetical protein